MDALEMLKQQHREVDELFDRIQRSNGDEKIQLLGRVCERLTLHAQLEERHFYPVQHHVKEEENTFFPRLSSLVNQDDLIRVAGEMQRTVDDLSKQELLKMAEQAGAEMPQQP